MYRKLILLCLCIILPLSISLNASAHSGRTDANGGHTDNSTGEYHYHHGYSVHDHWDMDGDGDIDCPYDFNDQTGSNSGGNTGGMSSTSNYSSSNDNVIVRTETITKTVTKEVPYIPSWIYLIIAVLSLSAITMFILFMGKRKEVSVQQQNALNEASLVKNGIITLHKALVKQYGQDYLYEISGAPSDAFVDNNFLPHDANYLINPHYDRYTFFLGSSPYNYTAKYHHRSCRYAKSSLAINAHTIRKSKRYQNCMLCSCSLPDTAWVEEYSKHYSFFKKYIHLETGRQQDTENC